MLELAFARIIALLGEGTGLTFYVNCVVVAILFLCCFAFFTMMFIAAAALENKKYEELFSEKLLVIIKGVMALTLLCYIIYLLISWNSWTVEAPLMVVVVSFVGAIIVFGALYVAYKIGYNLIYTGIKEMFLLFKKK